MKDEREVLIDWSVSMNTDNREGSGDKPPFELYSVYPPMRLAMWGLNISDASNWMYPFRVKVVGGSVCVTRAQVEKIIAAWLHLTKLEAAAP